MRFDRRINVVVPASLVVAEFQPNENLLQIMGTTVKDVIELYLSKWLDNEKFGYVPGFVETLGPEMCMDISARFMAMDLLFEMLERRLERQGPDSKDPANAIDRRDFEKVLHAMWDNLSAELFPLFDTLGFRDQQIQRMHFEQWLGDDIIVSIPTIAGLYEEQRERQEEEFHARRLEHQEREDNFINELRANSPFCGHHRSRGDHGTVYAHPADESDAQESE